MDALQGGAEASPLSRTFDELLGTWFACVDQRQGAPPAAEWLDAHLAGEFVYLHGAGGRWGRQDILDFVSGPLSASPPEHHLRGLNSAVRYGDVVLTEGDFFVRGTFPGEVEVPNALREMAEVGKECRFATVWVHRADRWQCLLYQATPKLV